MKGLRYFEKLTALTMGKLCQQRWLLAGLVLLCLLLPLGAGRAAEVLRAVESCGEKNLPAGVEIEIKL